MQPQTKKCGTPPRRWCTLSCYRYNLHSLLQTVSRPAGVGMQPQSKSVASLLGGGVHSPVTSVIFTTIHSLLQTVSRPAGEGMQPQTKMCGTPPRRWQALSCYICNLTFTSIDRNLTCRRRYAASD